MVEKIMVKKNIYRTISRIIKVALFSLCLTSCDSLYDSVFDKLLKDTIESEVPYKEASVEKRTLESIYIKENPVKTVYGIGDEFSTENICVFAKYSNGSELDVTNYVSYTGFNSSEENAEILITLSYLENGITAITTFTVAVFNNYIKVQSLVFEDDYKNSVIGLGNSKQLQVTVLPENANVKAVNWKSSDPSIASVTKDGVVTALKEGFVTITAISVDNPEVTAECSVEAKYYHAESVQINEPEELVRIEETKTGQLTARVLPELASQKVNWKSADTSIATVDNAGVITGVKSGSVQIIAMAADDESKTDSYTVEIFKYPVTSIQIMDEEGNDIPEAGITIFVDGSARLTAAVNEDATHKEYTWSSGDENIAAVDSNGLVSGINGGSTTITATSVDNQEIVAVCTVNIDEITSLEPQDYQIGDVILKDGTFVSCNDVASMTSEQKAKAVAVIYGYRTEVTDEGTESYALGVGLEHSEGLAWCTESSPGYNINFTELASSCDGNYVYDEYGNDKYVYQFTGNVDGSDDWEYICSMDSVGTADPATYYPAWNYVINYGENKKFKGYYKTGWYMPTMKEVYKLAVNISSINSIITTLDGKKYFDSSSSRYIDFYIWTSSTYGVDSNYCEIEGRYNSMSYRMNYFNKASRVSTLPIKVFPCSVIHYEDYTTNKITVTYPSFTQSSIKLTSSTDDDGNYTFTVAPSNTNGQLEEGATYRWILDTTPLVSAQMPDGSQLSEDGTSLMLPRSYLSSLVSGKHVITVLQQTQNGDFFDACCYIDISYGTESNFTPQGNLITVVLPVYNISELNITTQQNNDGSYTFTAEDSSSGRVYTKYSWLLDGIPLNQSSSIITLVSSEIEKLTMGAHLITVLAQTTNGEYFDASCYIKCYEEIEIPQNYELLPPVLVLQGTKLKWTSVPYATKYRVYKYSTNSNLDISEVNLSLFEAVSYFTRRSMAVSSPSLGYDYYAVKSCYVSEESNDFSNIIKISLADIPELTESHAGTYFFVENNGAWTSNNQGFHSSSAISCWTFNKSIQGDFSIDWTVSSEDGCDRLTIKVNGNTVLYEASGNNSGTIPIEYDTGTVIEAVYRKDGSVDYGSDCATLTFRF